MPVSCQSSTKAEELNQLFQTDKWTPRKIDKVLWTYRE